MRYGKALVAGGAIAIAAVVAGGWLLGVQPLLASASASEQELQAVRRLNEVQTTRLEELGARGDALAGIRETVSDLERAIPSDEAMAEFLGEISSVERTTGARVISLTASPMTDLATGATSDGGATAGAPAAAASPDASATASASSATAAASSATAGVPGLKALPISLSALGSPQSVSDFIDALQSDGRYLSLSSIALSTDPATGESRADLVGTAYVLPSTG